MNKWADTRTRALTIFIGAPIVLFIVYLGSPIYDITVLIVGLLCSLELTQMVKSRNVSGLAVSGSIITAAILGASFQTYLPLLIVLILIILSAIIRPLFDRRTYAFLIIGSLYVGLPLGFLIPIRNHEMGLAWIYTFFAANWGTDTLALVGGRLFGRHKLAPSISPAKTIEGALVGFSIGVLLGLSIAAGGKLPLNWALLLCVGVSILTQAGDLIESWTKRRLGIKDTGSLLPGHGGFMDRIDGLLMAAPFANFLLLFFI